MINGEADRSNSRYATGQWTAGAEFAPLPEYVCGKAASSSGCEKHNRNPQSGPPHSKKANSGSPSRQDDTNRIEG